VISFTPWPLYPRCSQDMGLGGLHKRPGQNILPCPEPNTGRPAQSICCCSSLTRAREGDRELAPRCFACSTPHMEQRQGNKPEREERGVGGGGGPELQRRSFITLKVRVCMQTLPTGMWLQGDRTQLQVLAERHEKATTVENVNINYLHNPKLKSLRHLFAVYLTTLSVAMATCTVPTQ
jgi:hypothetical protein